MKVKNFIKHGFFCRHGMKHGCLEEQNRFHGSIQLQLGTRSRFHVYFAGLNWFASAAWTPKRQPAPWLTTSQLSSYLLKWVCFFCKASCWLLKQLGVLGHLLPAIPIAVFWSGIESWALAGRFILVSWTSLDEWLIPFGFFVGRKRGCPWGSLIFGSAR